MRKRIIAGILCVVLALIFTGCGKVIDLSDENNRLIAEYAADLLLKYDSSFDTKYLNKSEEEITTEASSEATTETVIEASSEATTEAIATETTTTEKEQETGDTVPPDSAGNETDIARIVGIDKLSITYDKYLLVDRYPSLDEDGAFIYLEAPEGAKLLVVKFNVTNETEGGVDVNLLDTTLDYKLVVNGTKAAKPMLTILMDDLSTYDTVVAPNSNQNAVLVFQISDSVVAKLQTMKLKVIYNNVENVINIM